MKLINLITTVVRYIRNLDECGEIGQANEYTVNGIKYVVESVFLEKTEKNASLKERIVKILENEDSYLTTTANDVTMTPKCVFSTSERS